MSDEESVDLSEADELSDFSASASSFHPTSISSSSENETDEKNKNNKSLSKKKQTVKQQKTAKKTRKNQFESATDEETKQDEAPPDFDCFAGVELTDESDSDEEYIDRIVLPNSLIQNQLDPSSKSNEESPGIHLNMIKILENLKETEKIQEQFRNVCSKSYNAKKDLDHLNVRQILALGGERGAEGFSQNEDSDWEEVQGPSSNEPKLPQEGIEITLNPLGAVISDSKDDAKKKKGIEMAIKRKLNRIKKENQLNLHKSSLASWIAHGNFVNKILCNSFLKSYSRRLLPKNRRYCYPKDQTNPVYFKHFTHWFKNAVHLRSNKFYCSMTKRPHLLTSLLLQIKTKKAICRRDMILMYILLLRSIRINCRMVMSLNLPPVKLPASHFVTPKDKTEQNKEKGQKKKKLKKRKELKSSYEKRSETRDKDSKRHKSKHKKKSKKHKSSRSSRTEREKQKESKSVASTSVSSRTRSGTSPQKHSRIPQIDGADDFMFAATLNGRMTRSQRTKLSQLTGEAFGDQKTDENMREVQSESQVEHQEVEIVEEKLGETSVQSKNFKEIEEKSDQDNSSNPTISKNLKGNFRSSKTDRCSRSLGTNITTSPPVKNQSKKLKVIGSKQSTKQNFKGSEVQSSKSNDLNLMHESHSAKLNFKYNARKSTLKIVKAEETSSAQSSSVSLGAKRYLETNGQISNSSRSSLRNSKMNVYETSNTKSSNPSQKAENLKINGFDIPESPKFANSSNQENIPETSDSLNLSASIDESGDLKGFKSKSIKYRTESKAHKNESRKRKREEKNEIRKHSKKAKTFPEKTKTSKESIFLKSPHDESPTKSHKRSSKSLDYLEHNPSKKSRMDFNRTSKESRKSKERSKEKSTSIPKNKVRDRRVLSTDEDEPVDRKPKKKQGIDLWVEVFSERDEEWIPINVFEGKIDCAAHLVKTATQPVSYVFAWNRDGTIKDLTPKYCPTFNGTTRKLRVEEKFLNSILKDFKGKRLHRDKKEDLIISQVLDDRPLPTTISEFKNHPFYALERHLLKFEAIYPSDCPTVGFIDDEPIYPRDCVYRLHSREIWVKQARVVRAFEKPYKIVTARPRWDRATNTVKKDIPLEIFGIWQTDEYEPPTAENGVVPRNAYGNVELFKPCMLPKKTVHLQLLGLNRICNKLNIDCARAVVGFDYHSGSSHPAYDGFVICEEFADQVTAAWKEEQGEIEQRKNEKVEKRVIGNWVKLVKGLMIREKLRNKYNF